MSATGQPIHLCIVSEQLVPNLLPVLLPGHKPQACMLLASQAMQGQAQRLKDMLSVRGVQTSVHSMHDTDLDTAFGQLASLEPSLAGAAVTLNITGGTKLMTLVAYEFAREIKARVVYVDTRNQRLIQLAPKRLETPLPDALTVADALACAGYSVEKKHQGAVPAQLRDLAEELIRNLSRFQSILPVLNHVAMRASETMVTSLETGELRKPALLECLSLFEKAGYCSVADDAVVFADDEARKLMNGGWLEVYVASVAHRLRGAGGMYDWCSNAKITNDHGVRNEVDLAFTSGNRLHLIECKTQHPKSMNGKDDAPHYKIKALRDHLGGVMAKAMLCSAISLRSVDRERLAEYKIRVVEGPALVHLEKTLRQWMNE
ncbi:MAG: DUF1887 family protein [Desulfovibrio sp.]|nr:DUF1887 family protein [Desulfovibrio sp.]